MIFLKILIKNQFYRHLKSYMHGDFKNTLYFYSIAYSFEIRQSEKELIVSLHFYSGAFMLLAPFALFRRRNPTILWSELQSRYTNRQKT